MSWCFSFHRSKTHNPRLSSLFSRHNSTGHSASFDNSKMISYWSSLEELLVREHFLISTFSQCLGHFPSSVHAFYNTIFPKTAIPLSQSITNIFLYRFVAQDKVWDPEYCRNHSIGGNHERSAHVCCQCGGLAGGACPRDCGWVEGSTPDCRP